MNNEDINLKEKIEQLLTEKTAVVASMGHFL
jgi:hypothetical protein